MKCRKQYKSDEKFREYRNAYKRRYRRKRDFAQERYRKWTEEEIQMVMKHEIPDTEIARILERSVQGIQNKRNRVKNMTQ